MLPARSSSIARDRAETGKRYTLQLGARAWTFQEDEARTDGTSQRRNRYDFTR